MSVTLLNKPELSEIQAKSKIRKLITELPKIAGCENAERLSVMFGAAYDAALENGTALDCTVKDLEAPGYRIAIINPENYNPQKPEKARIGFARLVLAEFSTYKQKDRISANDFDMVINQFAEDAMAPDSEIDAILTYEQAVTAGYWWF